MRISRTKEDEPLDDIVSAARWMEKGKSSSDGSTPNRAFSTNSVKVAWADECEKSDRSLDHLPSLGESHHSLVGFCSPHSFEKCNSKASASLSCRTNHALSVYPFRSRSRHHHLLIYNHCLSARATPLSCRVIAFPLSQRVPSHEQRETALSITHDTHHYQTTATAEGPHLTFHRTDLMCETSVWSDAFRQNLTTQNSLLCHQKSKNEICRGHAARAGLTITHRSIT